MNVDLLNLTGRERGVWDCAYLSGYLAGHDAGWRAADANAERAHRAAYRIVQNAAKYEPFEVSELKRENRWLRGRLDSTNLQPFNPRQHEGSTA